MKQFLEKLIQKEESLEGLTIKEWIQFKNIGVEYVNKMDTLSFLQVHNTKMGFLAAIISVEALKWVSDESSMLCDLLFHDFAG